MILIQKLTHDPISQTGVLDHGILGPLHALAVLQGHVELLVGDQELGSNILARMDLLLRMGADTRGCESLLISELKHSFNGRPRRSNQLNTYIIN